MNWTVASNLRKDSCFKKKGELFFEILYGAINLEATDVK